MRQPARSTIGNNIGYVSKPCAHASAWQRLGLYLRLFEHPSKASAKPPLHTVWPMRLIYCSFALAAKQSFGSHRRVQIFREKMSAVLSVCLSCVFFKNKIILFVPVCLSFCLSVCLSVVRIITYPPGRIHASAGNRCPPGFPQIVFEAAQVSLAHAPGSNKKTIVCLSVSLWFE